MEIARAVFNTGRTELAELDSRMLDNPVPQIDLELAFEAQSELVFPVVATLQGDELCLSVGRSFFGEWLPCSDPWASSSGFEAASWACSRQYPAG